MTRALALLLVAVVGIGCAGAQLRTQTSATAGVIVVARENGAQRCAPVDLALAEAHHDFAVHALDEGNYHEARREAAISARHARIAADLAIPARCVIAGSGDQDGDGIPDASDRCPRVPEDTDGYEDEDGCPDNDNDSDGIADKIDACPVNAEDRDGFEDDDGCPDLDNDKDGFADTIDKCPTDPEDKDGFEDDDGCPDTDNDRDGIPDASDKCPNEFGVPPDGCPKKYTLVTVTETKIELKQTVFFDTNKSTIKPVSFALLDDVALALRDNGKLAVEIQGHTDSQAADRFNLKLSQQRADAVRRYLVTRGIAPTRMAARGYGENVPIADNRTAAGRAQNRRVEFVITAR